MTLTSRPMLLVNLLIWLAITAFGGYFLTHLIGKQGEKGFLNFGIDLVGGTYLTLDVKVEDAVKNDLLSSMTSMIELLKKETKDCQEHQQSMKKSWLDCSLLILMPQQQKL